MSRFTITDGKAVYRISPTEWMRSPTQDAWTRHLCWVGGRTHDSNAGHRGGEYTTVVPVFQTHTSHWLCYNKPALGPDDIDTLGYVADDLASVLCHERLRLWRAKNDPWSLLPERSDDEEHQALVGAELVEFVQPETHSSRDILKMPEMMIEGWDLGAVRAVLDKAERPR